MGYLRDRDRKQILDLQNKLQEMERENKELKRQLTLSSDENIGNLTETQVKIFNFIKKNDKVIKERIVDWCVEIQIASRVTALKAIKVRDDHCIYRSETWCQ